MPSYTTPLGEHLIQHWAECHGVETVCPEFKFKVATTFKDPLRRQIYEAVLIMEKGSLNRKHEFNLNELCSLVSNKHKPEREEEMMKEVTTKADTKMKMKNFVEIMSNVIKPTNIPADNFTYSRIKQCHKGADQLEPNKRCRIMETSTPIQKFSSVCLWHYQR